MKRKIINKLFFRKVLFFSLAASAVGALNLKSDYEQKKEEVVSVPATVVSEMKEEGIVDEDILSLNDENLNNQYITDKRLAELEKLDISMLSVKDFSFIKKCKNLKKLSITRAEMLSKSDFDSLKMLHLDGLTLNFDLENLSRLRENKMDFNGLDCDVKITNDFKGNSEEEVLLFLNYLENYDEGVFEHQEELSPYMELNSKLEEIYDSLGIDNSMSIETKVFLISNFLCENLEYDPLVNSLYNGDTHSQRQLRQIDSKINYYNENAVSSIVEQKGLVKSAICINYASLFDLLAYKAGIKTRVIIGMDNQDVHSWNVVYKGNEQYFVDTTFYDSSGQTGTLEKYIKNPDSTYYDVLNNELFTYADVYHEGYAVTEPLESLDESKAFQNKEKVFNKDIKGTYVLNDKLDYMRAIEFGAAAGVLSLLVDSLYRKVKKKIKEM